MKKILKHFNFTSLLLLVVVGLVATGVVNASVEKSKIISYSQRNVYDEKEDGWIYTFEINYPIDDSEIVYMFDGYNLKYKELDGYYVPVVDDATNEEIYRITPNYITLSISEEYKWDIQKIVKYFNEKQFIDEISISDLESLDILTISKEYLVDIFNRTINSELKTQPGEYYESSFTGRVYQKSTDESMPGEWQATYILSYGDIYDVNIEFITENGIYLSDKVEKNIISTTEKNLVSQIEAIENNIVSNQNVNSNEVSNTSRSNSSTKTNSDLVNLLKKLQTELIGN